MSELYLDLKRRIPVVTEWTDVGQEEIERAQARTGLSDEKIARRIPVSVKTWGRWKKRGQIPTHLLSRVAPILGFELVPLQPTPLEVGEEPHATLLVTTDLRESLATLVDLVRAISETAVKNSDALARIERAISSPGAKPRRARPRS